MSNMVDTRQGIQQDREVTTKARQDVSTANADLGSHSHSSYEDPLHAKGGEEGLQVARQPEGHGLAALQHTTANR